MAGNVRYWHKADVQTALMNVRFEGNTGRDADVTRCLLMTQSGHPGPASRLATGAQEACLPFLTITLFECPGMNTCRDYGLVK